jgi:hypothetical protein
MPVVLPCCISVLSAFVSTLMMVTLVMVVVMVVMMFMARTLSELNLVSTAEAVIAA